MRREKVNDYWYIRIGPDYPGSFSRGNSGDGWILEHRYVMEQHIGRFLTNEEVVHHINFDRSDNRIENLALLKDRAEHARIHHILEGNGVTTSICSSCGKSFEIAKGELRKRESRKVHNDKMYCSAKCYNISQRRVERPSKDELQKLVWEKPTTLIAEDFGVSDKAVEKWCKQYEVQKPPRGYWAKQKSSKI